MKIDKTCFEAGMFDQDIHGLKVQTELNWCAYSL